MRVDTGSTNGRRGGWATARSDATWTGAWDASRIWPRRCDGWTGWRII